MIDSIRLWYDTREAPMIDNSLLFANTIGLVRKTKDKYVSNTHTEYYQACLPYPNYVKEGDGWDIYQFHTGIRIDGSLCKWHFGQNADTLTLCDAIEAVRQLAEALGTTYEDLTRYSVIQLLDWSSNVITDYAPSLYYIHLDELPNYKRFKDWDETIYYTLEAKKIRIYDKVAEANKNKMQLPTWAFNKHLLRFELSWTRLYETELYKLSKPYDAKKLGSKTVFLEDILTEQAFTRLIEIWIETYESIIKTKTPYGTMELDNDVMKPHDLAMQAVAILIGEAGTETLNKTIDAMALTHPRFNKRQIREAKGYIKNWHKDAPTPYADLIQELNYKMRMKAESLKRNLHQCT